MIKLLRSVGGQVYVMGTTRRRGDWPGTMQTPGIPDLMAFMPSRPLVGIAHPILLFVECKADGGRIRPEQAEFRAWCQDAHVEHVLGTLDAVIQWLVKHLYVTEERWNNGEESKSAGCHATQCARVRHTRSRAPSAD